MYAAEGFEHQPSIELDMPAEKGLDFQVIKAECLAICFHTTDLACAQPILNQRMVHTPATVDRCICF